ncbi:MAG: PAS domain S-box protein [Deltaproteobacteria bacterium]|nr:PAS domain S-box protein [Deltaproteobacteria bacterium]
MSQENKKTEFTSGQFQAEDKSYFLDSFIHATLNPVFFKNTSGQYLDCNEKFAKQILGLPKEKILGRSLFDFPELFPKHIAEFHFEKDQELFKKPGIQFFQSVLRCTNGQKRNFSFQKSTVHDSKNEIIGVVGIMRDITTQKKAAEKLKESQKKVETIITNSPVGIFVIDGEKQIIVDTNPAGEALLGLKRSQILSKRCRGFLCQEPEGRCPVLNLKETVKCFEREIRNPKGQRTRALTSIVPMEVGGKEHLVHFCLDIQDQKIVHDQLIAEQREKINLFNALPSIVVGVSSSGIVMHWNLMAEKVFSIPAKDIIGKAFHESGINWEWSKISDEISRSISLKREVTLDRTSFQSADGSKRTLELTITPLYAQEGNSKAFVIIGSEITDKEMLKSQLLHSEKLASVGQLAAGIAHEINTPIQYVGDNVRFLENAFETFVDLLKKYRRIFSEVLAGKFDNEILEEIKSAEEMADLDYLTEEISDAIPQTLAGLDRVGRIVRSMKDFSHPGTKEKTIVDVNRLVESTVTLSRNEWKYVAHLETNLDQNLPPLLCLPAELNQVFLNLILNAAQALKEKPTPNGDIKGKILITTCQEGDSVEIRISDNGPGIPAQFRNRIFDPFFTTKGVGQGTGQGLAIARSVVVDKHQGSLHCESAEGHGCTFVIRLPIEGKER